jgi:Family of unknown function (DUF6191)
MSFFEIFQPGLRHLREERDRLKTLVARPTHGGGAPLGIDLDGGRAAFTMPSPPPPEPPNDPADVSHEEGSADDVGPVPTAPPSGPPD